MCVAEYDVIVAVLTGSSAASVCLGRLRFCSGSRWVRALPGVSVWTATIVTDVYGWVWRHHSSTNWEQRSICGLTLEGLDSVPVVAEYARCLELLCCGSGCIVFNYTTFHEKSQGAWYWYGIAVQIFLVGGDYFSKINVLLTFFWYTTSIPSPRPPLPFGDRGPFICSSDKLIISYFV
jgi:hypothetical protein